MYSPSTGITLNHAPLIFPAAERARRAALRALQAPEPPEEEEDGAGGEIGQPAAQLPQPADGGAPSGEGECVMSLILHG